LSGINPQHLLLVLKIVENFKTLTWKNCANLDAKNNHGRYIKEDVFENLIIPFVFDPPSKISTWNMKVNNYISLVFIFSCKFLVENGVVLLFHWGKKIIKGVTQVSGHFLNYIFVCLKDHK